MKSPVLVKTGKITIGLGAVLSYLKTRVFDDRFELLAISGLFFESLYLIADNSSYMAMNHFNR